MAMGSDPVFIPWTLVAYGLTPTRCITHSITCPEGRSRRRPCSICQLLWSGHRPESDDVITFLRPQVMRLAVATHKMPIR